MAAVAITRMDHTSRELRAAAKRSDDVAAARRMLALALVLEGKSRSEAADLLRDKSTEPARLGASLQCRRSGRAAQ
jgi:hypothetical protein